MEQLILTEQIIVGKLLNDYTLADEVFSQLTENDFRPDLHERKMFRVMKRIYDSGSEINLVAVADGYKNGETDTESELELIEISKNTDLFKQTPIQVYINELLKQSNKRKQLRCVEELRKKIHADEDISSELEQLKQNQYGGDRYSIILMPELVEEIHASIEESKKPGHCTPTGFTTLDDQLKGGLTKGWLYILCGRSGNGKTTLATTMFRNIAAAGKFPFYISLEQRRDQIGAKILLSRAGISSNAIESNIDLYAGAITDMRGWNGSVEDRARTISDIEHYSRKAVKEYGADVIFVDYIGLVQGETKQAKYEEIAEYSRRLKLLAMDIDRPVVCLSQINRKADERPPERPDGCWYWFKIPRMTELSDSSSLEKDADCILSISLNEADPEKPDKGIPLLRNGQKPAYLTIIKNRNGEQGAGIKMSLNGGASTFTEGGW